MGSQETIRIRIEKIEEGLITAVPVNEDGEVIEDSKLLQLIPGTKFKSEYIEEGLVYDASIGSHGEKKFLNYTELVNEDGTPKEISNNPFKPASKDIGSDNPYDRSALIAEVALKEAVKVTLAAYDKGEIKNTDQINKGIVDEMKFLYKFLKNKDYEKD